MAFGPTREECLYPPPCIGLGTHKKDIKDKRSINWGGVFFFLLSTLLCTASSAVLVGLKAPASTTAQGPVGAPWRTFASISFVCLTSSHQPPDGERGQPESTTMTTREGNTACLMRLALPTLCTCNERK